MDLKKKVGPFPTYVWIGIATVAALSAYLYLRKGSGSGSADLTGDTGVGTGGVIDPTTGQPYAGSVGDSGSSVAGGATTGPAPDLSAEVSDVLGLAQMFQASGLFGTGGSQATDQPGYDDTGVRSDIQGLAASLQNPSDHSAPTPVGARKATVFRPSKEHGGQLWEYTTGQSGKLIPKGKAPKGAKATAKVTQKKGATTSGAKTGSKGGSTSVGKPVAGHGQTTGSIAVKGHGNQKIGSTITIKGKGTYRVNSNGTLTKK